MMRRISVLSLLLVFVLIGCGGNGSSFPTQKRYWTVEDYQTVNEELTALKYNNKELPNLDNPETAPIFKKIIDTSNFAVVANDDQLGIQHRANFTSKMFDEYRDLVEAYSGTDRTDKYKYPLEFIEVLKFGLPLQISYISLGNQDIIKDAIDPNAAQVVDLVNRNKNILITNFTLYLEHINYEDRLNEKAIASYVDGLKSFFPKLINQLVPAGDYSDMLVKIDNMLKKTKNPLVAAELQELETLINSKK